MNIIIKAVGMLFIIFTATSLGVTKADKTKKRYEKLKDLTISFERLASLVQNGQGDLDKLIGLSFKNGTVSLDGNSLILDKNDLSEKDIELFEKYTGDLGMSDCKTEYKRISSMSQLFRKQSEEAESVYKSSGKLYISVGFLTGIGICIFLL